MKTARSLLIAIIALSVLIGLISLPEGGNAAPLMVPVNPGTTNLIAWWTMDETSGTRYDSYGANHLTDNNTVGYTTGIKGNAANFVRANSEYLSIADNANISINNSNFTLAGWFYIKSLENQSIINKETAWPNGEYKLFMQAANVVLLDVSNGSTNYTINNSNQLSPPGWYFIASWYDAAANTTYMQINGGTIATKTGVTSIADSTAPLRIGYNTNYAYFDGYMDELSFYKRVLSADERAWLYNSGSGRTYCDLDGACATPTPTNTATYTPTASNTPTVTLTPSQTPTVTDTPVNTPTRTPTATNTYTPTPTDTSTPTPSNTPTETRTPSPTITPGGPTLTPSPTGDMPALRWVGDITYGEYSNTIAIGALTLIVLVAFVSWIITNTMQRRGGRS